MDQHFSSRKTGLPRQKFADKVWLLLCTLSTTSVAMIESCNLEQIRPIRKCFISTYILHFLRLDILLRHYVNWRIMWCHVETIYFSQYCKREYGDKGLTLHYIGSLLRLAGHDHTLYCVLFDSQSLLQRRTWARILRISAIVRSRWVDQWKNANTLAVLHAIVTEPALIVCAWKCACYT